MVEYLVVGDPSYWGHDEGPFETIDEARAAVSAAQMSAADNGDLADYYFEIVCKIGGVEVMNLTPHPLVFHWGDRQSVIPVSGKAVRCSSKSTQVGQLGEIPLVRKTLGELENLPEPRKGVLYIVSAIAAQAAWCVGRWDVVVPDEPVRDEEGRIQGCRALGCGSHHPLG